MIWKKIDKNHYRLNVKIDNSRVIKGSVYQDFIYNECPPFYTWNVSFFLNDTNSALPLSEAEELGPSSGALSGSSEDREEVFIEGRGESLREAVTEAQKQIKILYKFFNRALPFPDFDYKIEIFNIED